MEIFFSDRLNRENLSPELWADYIKDFVRVDCPHRLTCRYADLKKKKHCVGYLFDYRHDEGTSIVAFKCQRARKVVTVRIDKQHHSFLDDGAAELPDSGRQWQKIRCPHCDQRLFDAVVEKEMTIHCKCTRDHRQLLVQLLETPAAEGERLSQN